MPFRSTYPRIYSLTSSSFSQQTLKHSPTFDLLDLRQRPSPCLFPFHCIVLIFPCLFPAISLFIYLVFSSPTHNAASKLAGYVLNACVNVMKRVSPSNLSPAILRPNVKRSAEVPIEVDSKMNSQMNKTKARSMAWALCRYLVAFAALAHPRTCDARRDKSVISAIGRNEVSVSQVAVALFDCQSTNFGFQLTRIQEHIRRT